MARIRAKYSHRKQRAVLTDMLPFEVPPTFSNRGFYRFLQKHSVDCDAKSVRWVSDTPALDSAIRLLFGAKPDAIIENKVIKEWGKTKTVRSLSLRLCEMATIPFNFRVAHKADGRTLSIIHPRNQIDVANFYARHSALITYYASRSEFSIRRPAAVARYAFYKDKLHELKLDPMPSGIEEENKEYEQLGSYFTYKRYRNIHRFFESHKYHRAEKKYEAMMQVDVNKCFDSIYTHSLSWALIGKSQTKLHLPEIIGTFGNLFDQLMQRLNHNETNGIVIGPEFSRIFAELILQSVDAELQEQLRDQGLIHKVNYQIFRYVDDFFIFYNAPSNQSIIQECLGAALKTKKLAINTAKVKHYTKPIITEITVAKEQISELLSELIDPQWEEIVEGGERKFVRLDCNIDSNRLIVAYKAAIKASDVQYGDLLNYTFAITENKIEKLFKSYLACDKTHRDQKKLLYALISIMEFVFFAYSASPKVNHTIRACRMIAIAVEFLRANAIPYELKHLLFKYVHDNIVMQLDKNTMHAHREIESLYFLTALPQIGKEYWLPETTLAKHFLITTDIDGAYMRASFLSHLAISVLLSYTREKVRYQKLTKFIKEHIIQKLEQMRAHCPTDAESIILFLDMMTCPFVDSAYKKRLSEIFDIQDADFGSILVANDYWCTAWGERFNLMRELDAKRSREVY